MAEWSTPRHQEDSLRVPEGFDPKVEQANRVSARAQRSIDASRQGFEKRNKELRAAGKPEVKLPPKSNSWSTPRHQDDDGVNAVVEEPVTREDSQPETKVVSAPTPRKQVLAPVLRQVEPPAPPPPSVQAEFDKLPPEAMIPVGDNDTQEAAIKRYKATQVDANIDKTIARDDKSEKYSEDIRNLRADFNNPNSDLRIDAETGRKLTVAEAAAAYYGPGGWGKEDSLLTSIAEVSPNLFSGILGGLGILMETGGAIVDMAGPAIQAINKNPELRDRINAAGKFIAGKEVLTGDTDIDTDRFGDMLNTILETSDALAPVGLSQVAGLAAAAPFRGMTSGMAGGVGATRLAERVAKTGRLTEAGAARSEAKIAKREGARTARARARMEGPSPMRMLAAGSEVAEKASRLADEAAAANQDIAQQTIKEFEISLRPEGWKEGDPTTSISTLNKQTGLLEIDPEKVRGLGKERARQLYHAERKAELRQEYGDPKLAIDHPDQPTKFRAVLQQTEEALAAGKFDSQIDALTNPMLNPDKFNAIVGIASDLRKASPDLWDDSKTVIDNLFDLTVQKKLTGQGAQEIADTMNKYGFSFDDYVLTIVGTGSEAGKVLKKLSDIRRARPETEVDLANKAAAAAMDSALKNVSQRIENIRRGGMVSQIATAARNLTSAGGRMPLEALQSVAETAMYNLEHGGFRKGLGTFKSSDAWRGAFKPMYHAFRNPREAKEYVDLILNKPELAPTFNRLFGNLNEIQMLTGRGQSTTRAGKVVDNVLSVGEDFVGDLNVFNRLQEFTVRRGVFLGQLENLTKREWGIDLIEALNEGKLTGMLNGSLKPEGKRSFYELLEDSTRLATDITYAKQPDTKSGRAVAHWITNASFGPVRATWVMPFPRFMMNALELMGQYGAGASIPLTKKVISLMKGGKPSTKFDGIPGMDYGTMKLDGKPIKWANLPKMKLTTKDRQRISRNLAGLGAFYAMYKYRTMDDAPADYKMMKTSEGEVIDTTPQFPMRQMLMVAELGKQAMQGDLGEWLSRKNNIKELAETFLGTNIRTGTGAGLMTDLVETIEGLGLGDVDKTDLVATEKAARTLGRAIGSYAVSWLTPFVQIKEAQRWLGSPDLLGDEGEAGKWFGVRPDAFGDVAKDPKLGASFSDQLIQNVKRPIQARGFGLTPKQERLLPERVRIGQPDDKRLYSGIKALTGLSFRKRDSKDMEYLNKLGYSEWTQGSKSKNPTIKRFENTLIREALPSIVEFLRDNEIELRAEYKVQRPAYKENTTEDQHVRAAQRPLVNDMLREEKAIIAETSIAAYMGDDVAAEIAEAQKAYRRLSKDQRVAAVKLFYQEENRYPTFSKAEDLSDLASYAIGTGLGRRSR